MKADQQRRLSHYVIVSLLLALAVGSGHARANDEATVAVITSFPASFYEPFRKGFEALHPQWRLRVVNRNTRSAINYIQSERDANLDLFWASAPDAFEVLKASGHLARMAPADTGIPRTIGRFPINDPDGRYLGFALSGYGLIWNDAYLSSHGMAVPATLEDLTDPAYAGHLVMTPPSRSGTTHLMIEAMLQNRGWEAGWGLLLEMGGNLATLTARSYSVAEGVARQRFGVGITIDFLALAFTGQDSGIHFAYPEKSPFLPASIALLNNAPNRPAAEAFIRFVLSSEGQTLLMREDILRLPVRPDSYQQAPAHYPNPYQLASDDNDTLFNSELSSGRYDMVNLLFDQLITYRLPTLSATWRDIHRAEHALRENWTAQAAELLQQARRAATALPMTAQQAGDPGLAGVLSHAARGMPVSADQTRLEERLQAFSVEHLEQAQRLAAQALQHLDKPAGGGFGSSPTAR